MTLQIRHTGTSEDGRPTFTVVRDGKNSSSVPLTPPWTIQVGSQTLRQGLTWYMEKYLELPVDVYQKQADAIQTALSEWGRETFTALFDSGGSAQNWYNNARHRLSELCLEIVSNDVSVMSWPWEVLESPTDGLLALQCKIERRIENKIGDTLPTPDITKYNQLNILYVVARPYGEGDVGFQTLARPVIDFVNRGK